MHLPTECTSMAPVQSAYLSGRLLYIYNIPKKLQGMAHNVGLTFSVGNTTPRFTISFEQDN